MGPWGSVWHENVWGGADVWTCRFRISGPFSLKVFGQTDDFLLSFQENVVEIPEVITPNGDGRNDIFRVFLGDGGIEGAAR